MKNPLSPRHRGRPEPRVGVSLTRILSFATAAAICVWCLVTPLLLLDQLQLDSSTLSQPALFVQTNNGALSVRDKSRNGPAVVRLGDAKLWTLEDASNEELRNKDWYEKGRMLVQKNMAYLAATEGRATRKESSITLVSGMFDLGRGDLKESFRRPFSHYVERFSNFLLYKFPKILFIQPEHYELYLPYLDKVKDYPVYVVNTTIEDIRHFKYYQEVQAMRTKPGWATRAGWLTESPQASMPLYNPMVMSKLLWTRDAARINPFNTDAFLWLDGGHLCNNPNMLTQEKTEVFKSHFDKLLITYFDYEPAGEIHGFEERGFRRYIAHQDRVLRVGRGGVFGGTKEFLEVASEVYLLSIGETLSAGYMGTEENIFSILHYRFPELVHDYENGEGGNCAIFSEAVYGPPPPPIETVVRQDGFDLRGLECRGREGSIKCYDGSVLCPDYVTPLWLSKAEKQYICSLRGSYCTVQCRTDGSVGWGGHSCPDPDQHCTAEGRVPFNTFYGEEPPQAKPHDSHPVLVAPVVPVPSDSVGHYFVGKQKILEWDYAGKAMKRNPTTSEIKFTQSTQNRLSAKDKKYVQEHGYNLRGLVCEIKDNKETCFLNHQLGRDVCPPHVDSAFLTLAAGQYSCQDRPENYCVAICQDGTDGIFWSAFNTEWCAENPEHCAPKPSPKPFADHVIRAWSEPPKPAKSCEKHPIAKFSKMMPFTVLVLCRGTELGSLEYALKTWGKGFMQYVDEWIFFVNDRTPEMFDLLEPYTKSPFNAKILSSNTNHGILTPIKWLIGNATNEHVLFLEKDFRIIESLPCALEQMDAGLKLLTTGKADVVKFRSRYNGGKANWADILYRGKEEAVFDRQPNLLCNFYHWIDNPEEVWPQHFRVCSQDPLMYCVDAEFCNWTNNPFFIKRSWWIDNYVSKHWEIQNPPEGFDLETWMNWDAGAWNKRGWTIAEGDGMFKHADIHKFGV